jgi:hypothetical protein
MFTTTDLVQHFSELLEKLKKDELCSEKVRDLTLLYVKHQKEEYDKKVCKADEAGEAEEAEEAEENLKYFALGWYIHNFLIKKQIK